MLPNVNKVGNFWEFMLHRPQGSEEIVFTSKNHGRRVHLVNQLKMPTSTGAAAFQTGVLQLPWNECKAHLDKLLGCWMLLDLKSPWMDNLLRVMRFRDLPADVRFFMAYTALQGIDAELAGRSIGKRRGTEAELLWDDFKVYWGHLLVPRSTSRDNAQIIQDFRNYTDLLVKTRHHIAHLSKSSKEILADRALEAGFVRIIMLLKSLFMDKAGVPPMIWKGVLEQWALRAHFVEHGEPL